MIRMKLHGFGTIRTLALVGLLAVGLVATTATAALAQASGTWSGTGSLNSARARHTATLLPNGQVLVVGGVNNSGILASAELYEPSRGKWMATGSMATARWGHSATLLPDGEVLVAGGSTSSSGIAPSAEAELYNPSTGEWTTTGSMSNARCLHGAALLASGEVLVAGDNGLGTSAELYDPATGKWTVTGTMIVAHIDAQAALLQDGRVLMAGGVDSPSGDIYSNGHWTLTSASNFTHSPSRTALLTSGDVLVIGGARVDNLAETYVPVTDTWVKTGPIGIKGLTYGPLTLLVSGKALLAGGQQITYGGIGTTGQCGLYDPSKNTWARTGSMTTARSGHTTTLLPSGQVLAVGGKITASGRTTFLASTELYIP